MRIKIDNNLQVIADKSAKDVSDMSYIMANALINAGLIKDDEEYYGCSVRECNEETGVYSICSVLHEIGIGKITDCIYDSFMSCIIIGNGDCPECGGEMELWDCEGHEIASGDYDLPPEYVVDCEKWRCPICCHTIDVNH